MSTKPSNNLIKLLIGIAISAVFLYLAFRKIDLTNMIQSFATANLWLVVPATAVMFLAHWLRAWRWRFLLKTMKPVSVSTLFSATLIGYMGNSILPAHLGELFRANVVGHREKLSTTSVLATLVIERIIDVLSLLVIMFVAVFAYPFPENVTQSGYLFFVIMVGAFTFLILLKRQHPLAVNTVGLCLKCLPGKLSSKLEQLLLLFTKGINGLEKKRDYLFVFILSIVIWSCYWAIFHILFYAFNLVGNYPVTTISSVVMLVITTIAIIVPSSPGYIGTYHYLCQFSLELFGVPASIGLSYAIIAHGISIIPTAIVGLVLAWKEGLSRLGEQNPTDS